MDKLKEIVKEGAKRITNADKAYITERCEEFSVSPIDASNKCRDCWIDKAVEVYNAMLHYQTLMLNTEGNDTARYVLIDGVDLLINGERVNAATITDKKAERWIAMGLRKKYFKVLPNENQD